MGKTEKLIGEHGENLAESILSGLGVEMIEKIGTPVKLSPYNKIPGVFRVAFGEAVSGDRRGILPGGRSVLIEVKTILDRNLQYSDLRKHQPERLRAHSLFGGLSLLIWVHNSGVYIMEFPINGFESRKGITPARAMELDEQTRGKIEKMTSL